MLETDLDWVFEIESLSFPSPWSRRMLSEELEIEHSIPLVIEDESGVEGYVIARTVVDEMHIVNLAVRPAVRRKGYAKKLLATILREGVERGCKVSYLEVRTTNLAAIKLYEGAGFSIIRKRARYYEDGSDAYEMGVEIAASLELLEK